MSAKNDAPRSRGYLILHTVLCVIAALLLFFCISNTIALRAYTRSALTDRLRESRLSDTAVPFTGKTVSDYIMNEYVTDSSILPEDIAEAADGMGIPAFLADKLDQHFALLRGESDTPVRITPDEITGLLDRITESLHESCQLVITDGDKDALRSAVEPTLKTVNGVSDAFGSTKAGRAFERFGVSIWAYVAAILLLGLLARRWSRVRERCGRDEAGVYKTMGIALMIPAAISLLLVIIGGAHTFFIKDTVIGMYGVTKVLRRPYWYISITGVSFAFLLIELAAYMRAKAANPEAFAKKARPERNAVKAVPISRAPKTVPCVSCGKELETGVKFCKYCGAKQETEPPKPAEPAPAAPAASPASGNIACVNCGKEIPSNMKFCKYCGTNQQTGENIVDAVLNGTAGLPEAPDDSEAEQTK